MTEELLPPPRDGYRAMSWPAEFRADEGQPPKLVGHFARFGVFNEIDSAIEGRFMERIDPGAFTRTFKNNRDRIRVLLQHGKDPAVGEKPIATITDLRSDSTGPYYEAELLDGIDPLVIAGLRSGQYGVSYRFQVEREDWDPKPTRSPANPKGLPERTIREAKVFEFGPVTFPADAGADIAVRSLSDQFSSPVAPSDEPEAEPHPVDEARDEPDDPPVAGPIAASDPSPDGPPPARSQPVDISQFHTIDDMYARISELNAEIKRGAEVPGVLSETEQATFDGRVADRAALEAAAASWASRLAQIREAAQDSRKVEESHAPAAVNVIKTRDTATIYDVDRIRREARNGDEYANNMRDAAMRSVEGASFAATERATSQGQIEALLGGKDYVEPTEAAKRVLYTGSPAYRRAYHKYLLQGAAGPNFTPEEANAFEEARTALVTASNVAVPYDLDSTMAINTSGAINPARQVFRNVQTTSNDWRPMVSSGMTAVYEDEATAATDLSPAFTAPARLLVKAHTAATFSVEIQGDYSLAGGLEAELSREIADAKDVLEATQFMTGAGSTHFPNGLFTYYTANFLDTTTTLTIVPADLYKLEANIGPRHRGNTVWMGSPYFYSLVRAIDTAGGAGLWVDNLTVGNFGSIQNNGLRGSLIGHPAYECVAPANTSMATTEKVAILADRDRFVIIDRIGMNIELIPNFLDAATGYPTGQRMVYAWWRNTSVGIGLATLGAGRSSCIFRGK